MAPLPVRSAPPSEPGLPDILGVSPHLFWIILVLVALVSLCLLGSTSYLVYIHVRKSSRSKDVLPLHYDKTGRRLLSFPSRCSSEVSVKRLYTWHAQLRICLNEQYKTKKARLLSRVRTLLNITEPRPWTEKLNVDVFTSTIGKTKWYDTPPCSNSSLSETCSMSPASKAWAAEHDRLKKLEVERLHGGQPLIRAEPIPWVLYVPKEPLVTPKPDDVTASITIALPEPCVINGSTVQTNPPSCSRSPRPSLPAALSCIIEEAEDSEVVFSCDADSEDSFWSQSSAEFSISALPAFTLDLPAEPSSIDDSLPSIIIDECNDTALPAAESFASKLASFQLSSATTDLLQVPTACSSRSEASRPILGNVTRSNVTGGKFKLAMPPPRKRGQPLGKKGKENAPGHF